MRTRDPTYVDRVDRWFAGGPAVAPPPMLAPYSLGKATVGNRVAVVPPPAWDGRHGELGKAQRRGLADAARRGAGLVATDVVAVSPEGRITPGCAGLYEPRHEELWSALVEEVHAAGLAVALRIGHAGARGATRPRDRGADRPASAGAWPLMAASPVPYARRSSVPREMDERDMETVAVAFGSASRRAAAAGVDLLLVHMAHGYLLHGFLSPLTNRRADRYGGDLEDRLRFPLRVWDAVRDAWPPDRALGAAIPATDWARRGLALDDGVVIAQTLRERGAALLEPLAGQAIPGGTPRYGRSFLSTASNRIRNEARVPTLVGGRVTTTGEVNTLVAGGRADLVILSPR
jgi:anthraniloyl-CoA monooxygenase